jgi:hypothetical protein
VDITGFGRRLAAGTLLSVAAAFGFAGVASAEVIEEATVTTTDVVVISTVTELEADTTTRIVGGQGWFEAEGTATTTTVTQTTTTDVDTTVYIEEVNVTTVVSEELVPVTKEVGKRDADGNRLIQVRYVLVTTTTATTTTTDGLLVEETVSVSQTTTVTEADATWEQRGAGGGGGEAVRDLEIGEPTPVSTVTVVISEPVTTVVSEPTVETVVTTTTTSEPTGGWKDPIGDKSPKGKAQGKK